MLAQRGAEHLHILYARRYFLLSKGEAAAQFQSGRTVAHANGHRSPWKGEANAGLAYSARGKHRIGRQTLVAARACGATLFARRRPSLRLRHVECAAGGSSFRAMRDCRALRNACSVSIVFVNPAWRNLIVLTNARGPS